jgi:thiol-disulfide isomerase/thioredoxin
MKKIFLLLMGMISFIIALRAQSPPEIKPLNNGDTIPDINIDNIINYSKKEVNLLDFKGKLVIFDFFDTWCTNCIAALPKLDSLQKRFGNKIQIFVVDDEPSPKVFSFLQHNSIGKRTTLPFVTSDSNLSRLFPHRLVPHEVWITPEGRVKATTSADQVNANNIGNLLAGHGVHLRIKRDVMDFTMQHLFFFNKDIPIKDSDLKYYSILSGHIEGVGGGSFIKRDTNNLILRICFTNASVKQLYQFAFNIPWYNNRYILEVKYPSNIEYINGDLASWNVQHTYCYELLTPPVTLENACKKMQEDLENYFHYDAKVVTRKTKCLVINTLPNIRKPISMGGKPGHNFVNFDYTVSSKYISNQPISELIDYLNSVLSLPVINETNFTQNVDMKLPNDPLNIDSLKSALHQYGFDMKEAERDIKVFVISDKQG